MKLKKFIASALSILVLYGSVSNISPFTHYKASATEAFLSSYPKTVFSKAYNINAISNDETLGTVVGGETQLENRIEISLTAFPNGSAVFEYWLDSNGNTYTDNPLIFEPTSDESFTAFFKRNTSIITTAFPSTTTSTISNINSTHTTTKMNTTITSKETTTTIATTTTYATNSVTSSITKKISTSTSTALTNTTTTTIATGTMTTTINVSLPFTTTTSTDVTTTTGNEPIGTTSGVPSTGTTTSSSIPVNSSTTTSNTPSSSTTSTTTKPISTSTITQVTKASVTFDINDVNSDSPVEAESDNLKAVFNTDAIKDIMKQVENGTVELKYEIIADTSAIATPELKDAVDEALKSGEKVISLTITDEQQNELQLSEGAGSISITIPYIASRSNAPIKIYSLDKNGNKQEIEGVYDANTHSLTFEITRFAIFAIEEVSTTEPVDYKLGDVNNDGKVNAVDASTVLTYYANISTNKDGGFTEAQKKAADLDNNGDINAVDASYILSYYAYTSTTKEEIMPVEEYMKKK